MRDIITHGWTLPALTMLWVPVGMAADLGRGAMLFQTCAACHSVLIDESIGPDLRGVVGRKAASLPGFRFSSAMLKSGLVWDEKTLREFLASPQVKVPGTSMSFEGYSNSADQSDVIAYLKTLRNEK
jgi:cytochrome c